MRVAALPHVRCNITAYAAHAIHDANDAQVKFVFVVDSACSPCQNAIGASSKVINP